MAESSSKEQIDSLSVPWVDTVRFIRQLSHDLRNHLNAIELQSAYISELEGDANLKGEVNRLREMISRLTSTLQQVSGGLGEVKPNLISYRASDFVEDLRKKIAQEFPNESTEISWDVKPATRDRISILNFCRRRSWSFLPTHSGTTAARVRLLRRRGSRKSVPLYASGTKNPI